MSDFVSLHEVSKHFQDHLAVNKVSLTIPKGKIYALLGPNGAGKTTLIRMITGIFAPDSGEIFFDGRQMKREDITRIGYMPEERGLYKKTKVIDQITYLLRLKGMDKQAAKATALKWLDKMGLKDWENKLTTDLSKGMQQKVQFISTVAHEPDLLILDEPVSGLDPVNAKAMEAEIMALKAAGKTIIFSTHRLEQVEEFCDYLALIHKGKVLIQDTLPNVRSQFQKNHYRVVLDGDTLALPMIEGMEILEIKEQQILISLHLPLTANQFLQHLIHHNISIQKFEKAIPKLNDIFIELVGGAQDFNTMIDTPTEK